MNMIIINKKRIKIILSCILISVFTFAVQATNGTMKSKEKDILKTTETTATPASGKTIVLDAGHPEYLLTR